MHEIYLPAKRQDVNAVQCYADRHVPRDEEKDCRSCVSGTSLAGENGKEKKLSFHNKVSGACFSVWRAECK